MLISYSLYFTTFVKVKKTVEDFPILYGFFQSCIDLCLNDGISKMVSGKMVSGKMVSSL